MSEDDALLEAFDAAVAGGDRCAMATVVSVEGSSYRRPGARMLVREDGSCTGTVSAGCLEADVAEHAKRAMRTGAATLAEYDTSASSEELAWGLGLGCNGVVRVLVEPLSRGSLYMDTLRRTRGSPSEAAVTMATFYRHSEHAASPAPARVGTGARIAIDERGAVRHEGMSGDTVGVLASLVRAMVRAGTKADSHVGDVDGGAIGVLVETLQPPVPLLVFGAGADAVPVVQRAAELGWRTEVADPQARTASRSRFAMADRVTLARPEDVGVHVRVTPRTMAVVMTHDYAQDLALLGFLLASPARYIGVLGPRHRTERMLRELAATLPPTCLAPASLARLHAPAGLDIGANGPVEIALSIVAEMRAALDGRSGGSLRERHGAIHDRAGETTGTALAHGPMHGVAADQAAIAGAAGIEAWSEVRCASGL